MIRESLVNELKTELSKQKLSILKGEVIFKRKGKFEGSGDCDLIIYEEKKNAP